MFFNFLLVLQNYVDCAFLHLSLMYHDHEWYTRVVTAGRQLARSLELQSLNDLGFSKRFVRCLQARLDISLKLENLFNLFSCIIN